MPHLLLFHTSATSRQYYGLFLSGLCLMTTAGLMVLLFFSLFLSLSLSLSLSLPLSDSFSFSSWPHRGSRLSRWRELASSEEEKLAILKRKEEHLKGIFQDRGVARRLMAASESSGQPARNPCPQSSLLYLTVDGMDQVSFLANLLCAT